MDKAADTIVNLTPHAIVVCDPSDHKPIKTYPASGKVARLKTSRTAVGSIDGVPQFKTDYGAVEDLPKPADRTFYLVSALVRTAQPHRKDLGSPGILVRDNDGGILGCLDFDVNG